MSNTIGIAREETTGNPATERGTGNPAGSVKHMSQPAEACDTRAPTGCERRTGISLNELQAELREDAQSVMGGDIQETGRINVLTPKEKNSMLYLLRDRFAYSSKHYLRPGQIILRDVLQSLGTNDAALWSLYMMEVTGGSPDVLFEDEKNWTFVDCSFDSPSGRRNCVFDRAAERLADGEFNSNAVDMAKIMGINLLSADLYKQMVAKGIFDLATWSWIETSDSAREKNQASYGDNKCNLPCTILVRQAYDHEVRGGWRGYLKVPKGMS